MIKILQGDWIEQLCMLPDESVQCCVTSPPYWGLRDYGIEGQLGLERTPDEYVAKMAEGFREVRRVLRKDGVCFVNLGDTYFRDPGKGDRSEYLGLHKNILDSGCHVASQSRSIPIGMKPKDLAGIPWRVAFALQADGWWLRQDIIWSKPNPMPESVTDRCTKAHEYIFLLSKSARYFYDAEAVKEVGSEIRSCGANSRENADRDPAHDDRKQNGGDDRNYHENRVGLATRNKRSVWEIATSPFPEAHFATFPPKLVEPCILAGTSERGCCPQCGAPWERITESRTTNREGWGISNPNHATPQGIHGPSIRGDGRCGNTETRTLGWQPTCTCNAGEPIRCTVLDPFNGAGTTGLVATRLGRDYIGIDLNHDYIQMGIDRIVDDAPLFNSVTCHGKR
jgi:DNA modification methylase